MGIYSVGGGGGGRFFVFLARLCYQYLLRVEIPIIQTYSENTATIFA
jgi:hypothetical protein